MGSNIVKKMREKTASLAECQVELASTSWAKAAPAKQKGNGKYWKPGTQKCSLFVHDILYAVGIPPPRTRTGTAYAASHWKGNVPGFKKVISQERGDIVTDGTHMGIAVNCTYVACAGDQQITDNYWNPKRESTIQRYCSYRRLDDCFAGEE